MTSPASRRAAFMHVAAALAAGALGALGQAPYDLAPILLVALAAGFGLWRRDAAHPGLLGWAFGLGYFTLTLSWIVEPFQVDAARHGWMAPFALVFMAGGLALFWGAAFWLARSLSNHAGVLLLAWTGAEILRAYVLTGFPWASPAQVVIHGPASALLALTGPHGTTLAMLAVAAVLSLPVSGPRAWMWRVAQAGVFIVAVVSLTLPDSRPTSPTTPYTVRLVQPNAAQHLKWRPDMAEVFFERQLDFTAVPGGLEGARPDLVVWPETSITALLGDADVFLARIAEAADGVPVALGVLRRDGGLLRNALVVLGPAGEVLELYDKHHLVPFGEYVPLAGLVEGLDLRGLAAAMGGFSSGPGPKIVEMGPLGAALPLICYEAVFAHGVNAAPERPAFLLQVTNDAWFGRFSGPQQHLAQARMRAIEQGLPLMRSANTGISAMIDPLGRMVAHLPLGEAGFIDARLPQPLSRTLYSRTGDWPAIALVIFGLLAVGSRRLVSRAR